MNCLLQKTIVQLLLISILATAATAKYEYDYNSDYVNGLLGILEKLQVHKAEVHNSHAEIEWKLNKNYDRGILYEVQNSAGTWNNECNGGPVLLLDKGPVHCLTHIAFHPESEKQQPSIGVEIGILNIETNDEKVIYADLFEQPEDEPIPLPNLPKLVRLVYIIDVNPEKEVDRFVGQAVWFEKVMDRGVFYKEGSKEIVAYPIVMCPLLMKNLLRIRSPKMLPFWMDGQTSVKKIISSWTAN